MVAAIKTRINLVEFVAEPTGCFRAKDRRLNRCRHGMAQINCNTV